MNTENMERWEWKFTAFERGTLIIEYLAKVIKFGMNDNSDDMCGACFVSTGYLITILPNNKHHTKVRPQGISLGKFSIIKEC